MVGGTGPYEYERSDLDVIQVRKQREEVGKLLRSRATGRFQGDGSQRRREMSKMTFKPWNKTVDVEILDCEVLDVRKCEEVTRIPTVEGLWQEPAGLEGWLWNSEVFYEG